VLPRGKFPIVSHKPNNCDDNKCKNWTMKANYVVSTDENGETHFQVNSRVKADRKFGKTSLYGAGWAF